MTPATPLDAPATPAAQPYGSYRPTPSDEGWARLVGLVHQGVYALNDEEASILPPSRLVH